MAKLYWTSEIRMLMDNELARRAMLMIANNDDDDRTDYDELAELRICHRFANEILSQMEEADRKEDEEREARRKEQKDATAT